MIYVGYNKKSSLTAKMLVEHMNSVGIKARRINDKRFKFKPSVFVRWGNSYKEAPEGCIELNSIEAVRNTSDKDMMARILSETPEAKFPPCWFFDRLDHDGSLIAAYGTAGGMEEYDVARRSGLYYRNSVNVVRKRNNYIAGDSYATIAIDKSREFRVHVFNGKVMGVYEKVPEDQENLPEYWKDDTCSFKRLDMSNKDVRSSIKGVRPAAVAATNALGLLFGGADVMMTADGEVFVNEVNSAPGLNTENVIRFTEKIKEYVAN
jgi:hypothetical protein